MIAKTPKEIKISLKYRDGSINGELKVNGKKLHKICICDTKDEKTIIGNSEALCKAAIRTYFYGEESK